MNFHHNLSKTAHLWLKNPISNWAKLHWKCPVYYPSTFYEVTVAPSDDLRHWTILSPAVPASQKVWVLRHQNWGWSSSTAHTVSKWLLFINPSSKSLTWTSHSLIMSDKHFSHLVVRVNSETCRNQRRKFPPSITQANLQINLSRTDFRWVMFKTRQSDEPTWKHILPFYIYW